jgi:hypothetical protein
MFRLYLAMKECSLDQISAEQISIASGMKVLDPGAALGFLRKLESDNEDIRHAFEKQVQATAVS